MSRSNKLPAPQVSTGRQPCHLQSYQFYRLRYIWHPLALQILHPPLISWMWESLVPEASFPHSGESSLADLMLDPRYLHMRQEGGGWPLTKSVPYTGIQRTILVYWRPADRQPVKLCQHRKLPTSYFAHQARSHDVGPGKRREKRDQN